MAFKRQARAPVFDALGNETRLSLVAKLCDGQPYSITQLTQGSKLTRHKRAIQFHEKPFAKLTVVRKRTPDPRN
jgi:hypothetical protein